MKQNNSWLWPSVVALEKAIVEKNVDGTDKLRKLTTSAREILPLDLIGSDKAFDRELAQLKRSGGSELGGSVFYSCASQLKSIIAEKIGHVQELIDLDPHALDHGHVRPLRQPVVLPLHLVRTRVRERVRADEGEKRRDRCARALDARRLPRRQGS